MMKENFLPWFLLFCALGLSGTAAYYSVVGLSVVFVGVAIPVIIMGGFLEISKIAIATYLHDKWKETYGVLKIYLTVALVTLSLITSLGIYGLLSTGFQGNIAKLEINQKRIKNIEVKKERFEEIKIELQKEKGVLDNDISKLRDGLSNNTTTQTVDRKTGQLITKANNANRKSFEDQLNMTTSNRDKVSIRIDNMNDSVTKLDIQVLDMESAELEGSELGAIKYISEVLGWDIKEVANLFILLLIFVFDPLAITLVIATNQAFKNKRKPEVEISEVGSDIDELSREAGKIELETIKKEKYEPTEEDLNLLQKVLEENYTISEGGTEPIDPTEEDLNRLDEILNKQEVDEAQNQEIEIDELDGPTGENGLEDIGLSEESIEIPQPKKLSYLNRNGYGKSLRINRL
jgi:hypothetical protein